MSSKHLNGHNGHKERVACCTTLMRSQVVDQLEEILKSVRKGQIHIQHGQEALDLNIGDHVCFEFQAKSKGEQQSLTITLRWDRLTAQDRLVIGTAPAQRATVSANGPASGHRATKHPAAKNGNARRATSRPKTSKSKAAGKRTKTK